MWINCIENWHSLWYYERMERYKIVIQYDGSGFCGFQVQPEKRTVQGELEKTLSFLLQEDVKIYASGRTDAGVSAEAQVAHFDTEKEFAERKMLSSINALLQKDVAVTSLNHVSMDFDARFSAKKKTYQYRFYVSKYELPLYSKIALRVNDYIDVSKMQEATKYIIGTHDFRSFVARKSGKTDFVRTVYDAKIIKIDDTLFAFEITGNGFLYNMVRILFGTLLMIGYGQRKPEDMKKIIEAKDRAMAGKTMSAHALLLKNVEYDTKKI